MPDFSIIEDTLFVPMLGRIYATEKFPNILNDTMAITLKEHLPQNLKGADTQTQYTFLASAVRSANIDRHIMDFLKRNPNGIIAQLGCGLETNFYRCNTQNPHWYEIDLPRVIAYRNTLLSEQERETYIAADAFCENWIQEIRLHFPDNPILVTASGLFYYFTESKIISLLKMLKKYGNTEIVFDAVNAAGMKQMGRYMKQAGHEDALMYFYVNNVQNTANKIGASLAQEEPYYKYTPKVGLSFLTVATMKCADWLKMLKMIHIKLNE